MKKLLLPLLLLLVLQGSGQQTDEAQIRSILDAQTKAWNEGRIEQFMNGYWQSDSLLFIGSKGLTYGYNATLNNYRKNYPDRATMGELNFSQLRLQRISNDAYFVTGSWKLTREQKGDIGGHFSLLWRKINGVWVIVADHSS